LCLSAKNKVKKKYKGLISLGCLISLLLAVLILV